MNERANEHKYTIGNIPPYQHPMPQPDSEADQQTSVEETGQNNLGGGKAQPKHHRYQMSDIPEYEPTYRRSVSEAESIDESEVDEPVQQENTYVENRPLSNVGKSSNGVTPISSSFWILPHGEDIQSPHSEVAKDSSELKQVQEQSQATHHQKIEDVEDEISYPEIYMLPQSSIEPLDQNTDVDSPSATLGDNALSAPTDSFLSIVDTADDEELPF